LHYVSIKDLKVGDVLAKQIIGNYNRLMLAKGVRVTDDLLNRIREHGVEMVFIEDKFDTPIVGDLIDPELRQEAIQSIKETTMLMKESVTPKGGFLTVLERVVDAVIYELNKNNGNMVCVLDLKSHDNYTYEHSVNVSILAIVIGMAVGFDYAKLRSIGIGAMLHDIGKTFIPVEILNKKGKLTEGEFELIKQHPLLGFNRSKLELVIDPTCRSIILQHHEKLDGSGYPNGRTEMTIHDFAKIVSICDIYDALASDRTYRKRWPIKETLDYMESICGKHLDTRYYEVFKRHVSPFPIGIKVLVSNGVIGYVINNDVPLRPVVGLDDGSIIDLRNEHLFYIREIVD
jgi:HD-GYP domain-containing protein (c-di-GMP phosphodiesterase class II)